MTTAPWGIDVPCTESDADKHNPSLTAAVMHSPGTSATKPVQERIPVQPPATALVEPSASLSSLSTCPRSPIDDFANCQLPADLPLLVGETGFSQSTLGSQCHGIFPDSLFQAQGTLAPNDDSSMFALIDSDLAPAWKASSGTQGSHGFSSWTPLCLDNTLLMPVPRLCPLAPLSTDSTQAPPNFLMDIASLSASDASPPSSHTSCSGQQHVHRYQKHTDKDEVIAKNQRSLMRQQRCGVRHHGSYNFESAVSCSKPGDEAQKNIFEGDGTEQSRTHVHRDPHEQGASSSRVPSSSCASRQSPISALPSLYQLDSLRGCSLEPSFHSDSQRYSQPAHATESIEDPNVRCRESMITGFLAPKTHGLVAQPRAPPLIPFINNWAQDPPQQELNDSEPFDAPAPRASSKLGKQSA